MSDALTRELAGRLGNPEEAAQIVAAADGDEATARQLAERRAAGEPLAYVLGRQTFLGLELLAAPGALVARSETELLARAAIERIADGARVIDMCSGSGNLACAIAHARPATQVWACDLTAGCVELARRNASHIGAADRVTVLQGDLFQPLAGLGLEGTVAAIVCNPPYISTGKLAGESAALLKHEPREAFDGGPYGLSIHQRVMRDAVPFLAPGGSLLFEIGAGQERQITLLLQRARAYDEPVLLRDTAGDVRVAVARKP